MLSSIRKAPQSALLRDLAYTSNLIEAHRPIDLFISHLLLSFCVRRQATRFRSASRDILRSTLSATATLFAHMRPWVILLHDVHIEIFAHVLRQPAHDVLALFFVTWHDEMAEQDAFLC